jgi:hypothetical protein
MKAASKTVHPNTAPHHRTDGGAEQAAAASFYTSIAIPVHFFL